jgi:hypothetical protein
MEQSHGARGAAKLDTTLHCADDAAIRRSLPLMLHLSARWDEEKQVST